MLSEHVGHPDTDAWELVSFVREQSKQRRRHYARAQRLSPRVGLPHELGWLPDLFGLHPDVFVGMPDAKVVMPSQHGWELHEDGPLQRELALEPWEIVEHPSPWVGERCARAREQCLQAWEHCLFVGEHCAFATEHSLFVREHYVFVPEHSLFVTEQYLFVTEQYLFGGEHYAFGTEQCLFVMDRYLFVTGRCLFVREHCPFAGHPHPDRATPSPLSEQRDVLAAVAMGLREERRVLEPVHCAFAGRYYTRKETT
jgi:hypothetical protein